MPNTVSIDRNGFIHQVLNGDQDGAAISLLVVETNTLVRTLQTQKKPINFIVDIRHIRRQSLSARRSSLRALKRMPYHKIALFGGSRFIRYVVDLVIIASGQQTKVKQFQSEAQAVAWLKR